MKHTKLTTVLAGIAVLSTILMGCEKSENGKETPKDEPVKTFQVNGVEFKMIRVDGGTFTMGATPEQAEFAKENEKPAHEVTLSTYYIAETETTCALWKALMGTEGLISPELAEDDKDPVRFVDGDVFFNKFLPRLKELTQMEFSLPTEAQWEFAARGGNKSQGYIYSGSNDFREVANTLEAGDMLRNVKSLKPNELGLYDMSGNAWELCKDWLGTYQSEPATDPQCPADNMEYGMRGGNYSTTADYFGRVSSRLPIGSVEMVQSFRLVLNIKE